MAKVSENTFVIQSNWATPNTEDITTTISPVLSRQIYFYLVHLPIFEIRVWLWSLKLAISVRKVKGESARPIKRTPDNLDNCFQCYLSSSGGFSSACNYWNLIVNMLIAATIPEIPSPAAPLILKSALCVQNKWNIQVTNKETGISEISDDGYITAKITSILKMLLATGLILAMFILADLNIVILSEYVILVYSILLMTITMKYDSDFDLFFFFFIIQYNHFRLYNTS